MTKKTAADYECKLFPYTRTDCLSIQEVQQQVGWEITAFDLPQAWNYSQGEGITIAVVDTGCDLNHPDLKDNLLPGVNFVSPGQPPFDDNCHGTHITGILVGENNNLGVVGVAPRAKVRPVKVMDKNGNGNMLNVARGIRWAIQQKVDFISMSLGCPAPVEEVHRAIDEAAAAGIITFCAAGNVGNTQQIFYPANYTETISVGAVDINLRRASFSNTGSNLDFMAPGVDILSTVPPNWYATLSGTSMAQPFVCGVAALLLSYVRRTNANIPLKTSADYVNLMKQYTTPVTNGNYDDPRFYEGFGIIDPRKFLESMKH